ncbi:MAG: ROK family glucokinase [Desulfitobacterium hafniense]|nr:ROK family glucokinase [Desulfitobacterium hafniense]
MTTTPHIIGIDLGGTNIKAALLDGQGNILAKKEIPTQADEGPEGVINRMAELARDLQPSEGSVLGVGIGIPGVLDYSNGKVIFAPNIHWRDVAAKALMEEKLGLPVYLDNDANAAALGEKWCGAARGGQNVVVITIGTGIGGGVIINGRIYRGSAGSAGEIGHTVVLEDGPQCNCGKKGCLETLTAAPAIVRMAGEAVEAGSSPGLAGLGSLEAKDVFAAAAKGDRGALDVVERAAHYLGMSIANVVNLLNPELVVIGGGVARAGEILFRPLRKRVKECALEVPAETVQVIPAQLGNDAGSVGAGAIVLEEKGLI